MLENAPQGANRTGSPSYLHPKEGDAGEKVHSGFEVLESLWAAGWEVILLEGRRGVRLWKKAGWGSSVLGETQEPPPPSFRKYVKVHENILKQLGESGWMYLACWADAAHICVQMSKEHIPHINMGPPMYTPDGSSPQWAHTCV